MSIPEFTYDPSNIMDELPDDLYEEYKKFEEIKSKYQRELFSRISYKSRKLYTLIGVYKLLISGVECKYAFRKGFEAGIKSKENS